MTALADHWHQLPHSLRAARAAMAVAGVLVLVLLARVLLLLLSAPQLPLATGHAIAQEPATGMRQAIAGWHLFGLPSDAPMAAAPTTGLALSLRGTVASADPTRGSAFITDAQGNDGIFHVGDTLPGGGRLQAVYAAYVILLNNGQRETLSLSGQQATQTMNGNRKSDDSAAAARSPDGGYLAGGLSFGTPDLQTQREDRAPDLQALATQANVLPVLVNGRMIGVKVSVPDTSLLERVGLQRDDIITAVNGISIDDPARSPALQNSLRMGGIITLSVRRGGQDLTISIGL